MFTGLVEGKGRVVQVTRAGAELDLTVDLRGLGRACAVGDSVALSGVCCTLVGGGGGTGAFRLTAETLARSWLGAAGIGRELNLEAALRAGDPLGGHIVQGHVDDVAEVVAPIDPTRGGELRVRLPRALRRYCVAKGSIALDGVSLTLARVTGDEIGVAVIPHTAQVTTLGTAAHGQQLNVEVDVLAKYVERLLEARRDD